MGHVISELFSADGPYGISALTAFYFLSYDLLHILVQVNYGKAPATLDLSKSPFSTYEPEPWPMAYAPIEEVCRVCLEALVASWGSARSCPLDPCPLQPMLSYCLICPLVQANTPPSSWYLSPQVAELEKVAIFQNNWQVSFPLYNAGEYAAIVPASFSDIFRCNLTHHNAIEALDPQWGSSHVYATLQKSALGLNTGLLCR